MLTIKSKGEGRYIILLGVSLFTLGAWLTGGLFPFNLNETQGIAVERWWRYALLRDSGAALVVIAAIVGGVRAIRGKGYSFERLCLPLVGYGLFSCLFIFHIIAYVQIGRILQSYDFSDMIGHMENILKTKSLPDNKRQVLLKKLAENRYLQTGERLRLTGQDHQQHLFEPSREMIRFKRQNDQSKHLFDRIRTYAGYSIITWIVILLSSTLAGIFSRLRGIAKDGRFLQASGPGRR